jgi:hypothetical protein
MKRYAVAMSLGLLMLGAMSMQGCCLFKSCDKGACCADGSGDCCKNKGGHCEACKSGAPCAECTK